MTSALNVRFGATKRASVHVATRGPALAAAVSCLLGTLYFRWSPQAPDLAAQVARTELVKRAGNLSWWTGWFGGLSMPTYSVLAPTWMATVGVRAAGVLAVVLGSIAAALLMRDALRPRAGAVAAAVGGIADLLDGRVTFTIGLAIAAWALVGVQARRPVSAAGLALVAYLTSPLAGLFLGLILLAVVVADESRRVAAALGAGILLASGSAMALLFPGSGTMPFTLLDAFPAALGCALVCVLCGDRVIRASAVIMLVALAAFLVVPGAVGDNATRLAWVCAAPVAVAYFALPRRLLAGVVVLLLLWPVTDLGEQLAATTSRSAQASYYQPLVAQLHAAAASAGSYAFGERVEVIDTDNHWASVYMSASSLARGWDRQADYANNPIFYRKNALTPASYHEWLHQLAVGWVALPTGSLDYASEAEAALVRAGLPYLQLTWSNPYWQLYRVGDAAPLATGARVTAVAADSVTMISAGATAISLRLRWSSYLQVVDPGTGSLLPACVIDADGWVHLDIPRAETFMLVSRFTPSARFTAPDPDCSKDLGGQ